MKDDNHSKWQKQAEKEFLEDFKKGIVRWSKLPNLNSWNISEDTIVIINKEDNPD